MNTKEQRSFEIWLRDAFIEVDKLRITDEYTGNPIEVLDEYKPNNRVLFNMYRVLYNFIFIESTSLNPTQLNQNLTEKSELADRRNSTEGIKEITFRTRIESQRFEFNALSNLTIQNIGIGKSVGEEIIIATQILENSNNKNKSRLFLDNYTKLLHQLMEVDLHPVAADESIFKKKSPLPQPQTY